jgi:dTDP-4-amino-4,6-dideoxygalactose transaminase
MTTPASSSSTTRSVQSLLAEQGGQPVRTTPWPARHLFGQAEKAAACAVFDQAIASGNAFGYQGPEEQAYLDAFVNWLEGGNTGKNSGGNSGVGFADAVNSGSSAVYVAVRSLDLEPFSEVIVPPITDPGGIMPVAMLGLIPVPADAAPGSLNTSAEEIARRITPRTRAILIAHIAGHPCDMDPILELAAAHHLPIIEDCAQAHGATYRGRPVGTMGQVAAFSTMSGKHHATAAQGGVVYTRDQAVYKRVRQAADRGKPFGEDQPTGNVIAGLNLNSNELACAVGRVQIDKLPDMLQRRRDFAQEVIEGAKQFKSISFMEPSAGAQSAWWFLAARVNLKKISIDKSQVVKALQAEGIPAGADYWHCPIEKPWYVHRRVLGGEGFPWEQCPEPPRRWTPADLPNALATRDTHFPIPMHENCATQEARDILAAIAKIEKAYGIN